MSRAGLHSRHSSTVRFWAKVILVAAVYCGVARLGLLLSVVLGHNTFIWPPTGVALATLVVFGPQLWPGITLGAFLAAAVTGVPFPVACGVSAGNTLEALGAVFLLRRVVRFRHTLHRLQDVLGLIGLAAGLSTMVSATIDVASFCLGGMAPWAAYGLLWRVWWAGGIMSDLVLAPLLLTWSANLRMKRRRRRLVELGVLMGGVVVVSLLVFGGWFSPPRLHASLHYAVFPFILWAALRFSAREAITATFIVSTIALWGTAQGVGPFARGPVPGQLLLLYTFLGITAMTALVTAAIVTERKYGEETRVRARVAQAANHKLQHEIAERRQVQEALQHRVAMETLVTTLSTSFINLVSAELDAAIRHVLQAVGEFAGVDRSYLFLADDSLTTVDNTHEWCAPGITPQIDSMQGVQAHAFPWLAERLLRFETIHIPRVAELPPAAQAEQALLQAQDVQSLIIVPLLYQGRPLGFLGFDAVRAEKAWMTEDIALLKMTGDIVASALERARSERELHQAKAAAEMANRAKSEFLATMSHELRTPLAAILGYTDLLLEETFGDLSEDQAHPLRRISSNGRELLDLITAMLDVSRLEAGRVPIVVKEVQLAEIIAALKTESHEVYHRSPLHFGWEVEAGLTPIHTDPEKLKIALRNLIGNAVKFTPRGSITVKVLSKGEGVEISVSDTGIGVPPEALAAIFEPFHQAEGSETRQYGGVGLGLHIVKRLLELLGGTVRVESTVGQGSTFRVWVPREIPFSSVFSGESATRDYSS